MKSVHYRTHTLPIFRGLNILPLDKIYRHCVIIFMFKFVKDMLPRLFNEIFLRNDCIRLTRQNSKFKVQQCKTTLFQNTMRFKAVKEWNFIDDIVDKNCCFHTYKKNVKKYLLCAIT